MKTFTKKLSGFPFIKQINFMECGTTCLAMIFKHYGYYNIRSFLSEQAQVNTEGTDLYTISELAEGFGFETNGYQLDWDHFHKLHLPCIAHYDGNHFVVVYKASEEYLWIADPAIGKYKLSKKEFLSRWNGVALELKPTNEIFKHNELTELVDATREKQKGLKNKFYFPVFRESRGIIFKILICTGFLQVIGLLFPFFTQAIIDHVLVNQNLKLLYAILIGMVAVFFSNVMLTFGRNMLLAQFKVSFERTFFSKFFDHFIHLKQSYFDTHKREDFINRFQENLKIRQALNPSILESLIDFTFLFTYLIVLFLYNSLLGSLAFFFTVLYASLVIVFSPRLKNLENKIFAENVKTMGAFLDVLLGMHTVKLLGVEKLKYWKWKNQYTRALNKVLDVERTYIGLSTLLNTLFYISQASIYWIGAYLAFQDQITIGQYIAFITIFVVIINTLRNISKIWFIFTELSISYDRVNDVLVQETEDHHFDHKMPIVSPFNISIQNVSFKYREKDNNYILKNIDIEIPHGQFVGIVGRNGSGKTTLIKLISRLYSNYEGRIFINKSDLKEIHPRQLRKKLGVIPQDIYLFDDTIKENIRISNPQASDDEVIEAARLADLQEFVHDQFLGYNLKIGENGVNLSGGQKLKIAFARLFVSNPEIIILDEASSALDISTEKKIMSNVLEKFKGKTIISIAHRIHTLKNADQIIVIENGTIVQKGSHDFLSKNEGLYKEFTETYLSF